MKDTNNGLTVKATSITESIMIKISQLMMNIVMKITIKVIEKIQQNKQSL